MTTSVYANGVRATAVAAIKAAAIAKFTAIGSGLGADGIKRLDVAGLTKWLQDQFVLISADSGLPAGATQQTSTWLPARSIPALPVHWWEP